jgi:hypothetical protein
MSTRNATANIPWTSEADATRTRLAVVLELEVKRKGAHIDGGLRAMRDRTGTGGWPRREARGEEGSAVPVRRAPYG